MGKDVFRQLMAHRLAHLLVKPPVDPHVDPAVHVLIIRLAEAPERSGLARQVAGFNGKGERIGAIIKLQEPEDGAAKGSMAGSIGGEGWRPSLVLWRPQWKPVRVGFGLGIAIEIG